MVKWALLLMLLVSALGCSAIRQKSTAQLTTDVVVERGETSQYGSRELMTVRVWFHDNGNYKFDFDDVVIRTDPPNFPIREFLQMQEERRQEAEEWERESVLLRLIEKGPKSTTECDRK